MMSFSLRGKHLWITAYAITLASAAAAQQFRVDEPDDKARRFGASATIWVRDPSAYTNGKPQFDEYFQKYYFPAMTRSTPNGLAELGKLRFELFKKFLWNTSNEGLQTDLTDMAYKAMVKIVGNNKVPLYHPAVQYNATLVIGLLDEQYAIDSGTNLRPSKPLPAATKVLTTIVNQGLANDRFPPPVILGALIGLERHAKYHEALPPDAVKEMTAALLKFVNQDKPIQGMEPDTFSWLRLRAASALVNLGTLGENNAVHDALVKLIGSSKSIDDRCSAADLLGKLKYENAKIDAPVATAALFKLASDLSAEELKRAMDFEKTRIAGGGNTQTRVARLSPDDPNATQDDGFPRRHVLARLVDLGTSLRAVRPAVPADSQKEFDAILAAIKPVIEAASNKETGSLAIANTIRTMNQQIEAVAGPADSAADDEDEFTASAPAPAAGAPAPEAAAPAETPAVEPAATPPAAGETPPAEAPAAEEPAAATN